MAAKTPDVSAGATVTFGTSSTWSTSVGITVKSLTWSGISRPAIDSTTLVTSGARTFMPGDLYDPGELNIEMNLDTDCAPIITAAAETITVTFQDGETYIASGFMTDFSFNVPENDSGLMTATAKFKLTGAITGWG